MDERLDFEYSNGDTGYKGVQTQYINLFFPGLGDLTVTFETDGYRYCDYDNAECFQLNDKWHCPVCREEYLIVRRPVFSASGGSLDVTKIRVIDRFGGDWEVK